MRIKLFFISVIAILISNACSNKQDVSMDTLTIHYHRYDDLYDNWTLWTWLDEHKTEIKSTGKDSFGLIFKINIDSRISCER